MKGRTYEEQKKKIQRKNGRIKNDNNKKNAQKDKENSKENIIEARQKMKVEESQEGKQNTKNKIEAERKIR